MNRLALRRALRRERFRGKEITGRWHDECERIEISNSPLPLELDVDAVRTIERLAASELPSGVLIPASAFPPRPSPARANPHQAMARARLEQMARPAQPKLPVDRSRLPVADSREPCRRCGARGDLGCDHQRAFEG